MVDKSDPLVSSVYKSQYPSAMAHPDSRWPYIEKAKAIDQDDGEWLCSSFNNRSCKILDKSGFFKVKDNNPFNLIIKTAALLISKKLSVVDKCAPLLSSDYSSLYPSTRAQTVSRWADLQTAKAIDQHTSEWLCSSFSYRSCKDFLVSLKSNFLTRKKSFFNTRLLK